MIIEPRRFGYDFKIDFIFDELLDGAPSDTVEYYSTYFKDWSDKD